MDGMISIPWSAHNDGGDAMTAVFELEMAPASAIVQFGLSGYWETDDQSGVTPLITQVTTTAGDQAAQTSVDPPTPLLVANKLSHFRGEITLANCNTFGIVNVFIWPSVS